MTRSTPYDLLVIGGGINGCGIAADAAGRGLSVLLAEQGDLAGGTSSASSKLIHGGLRYLEHYEFRLVRESLQEREVLLRLAPHIVWPLRFVLPHAPGQRPAWMIRAGLFLYDHLAARHRIPGSASLRLHADPAGAALRSNLSRGFSYWDCWVDDARLVVLNARSAARRGAEILTRTPVVALRRELDLWRVSLSGDAGLREVAARAVVNAAGPWTERIARLAGAGSNRPSAVPRLRLVRGSHIVVPRILGGDDAFLLQSPDGRVVFMLPYEGVFTLIGTTDEPHTDDLLHVSAGAHEVRYLLDVANRFLRQPLEPESVIWSFAGVRPLDDSEGQANPSAVSRDWRLVLEGGNAGGGGDVHVRPAPIVHVVGGKITTYRRLAEAAMTKLEHYFQGLGPAWTASAVLPGGDIDSPTIEDFARSLAAARPGIDAATIARMARRHGSDTVEIIGDSKNMSDLGEHIGGSLYGREVVYLRAHEWARQPDDILWRRTRAGLHIDPRSRSSAAERINRLL